MPQPAGSGHMLTQGLDLKDWPGQGVELPVILDVCVDRAEHGSQV